MKSKKPVKTILIVVGARPQFIKAAPVLKALKETELYRAIVVHTGQHYDKNMSGTFFDELDMQPPNYNLGVGSGGHGEQTGEIMKRLEPIMMKEKPELTIVFGDTNSTMAGALVASKLHIPVAHVEAGLRSYNRVMPEEINRVLTDHISALLFCPTSTAVHNLRAEGIRNNVFNIGDVMYDVAIKFSKKAAEMSTVLSNSSLKEKEYALVTVHRAENTDSKHRLFNIFSALNELARTMPVVLPMHPRTRKMLFHFNYDHFTKDIKIIEPVGFLDMLSLEMNAKIIITDSGGVQKEAYFHRVPCVTLRDETEWVETIEAQWNMLADVRTEDGVIEVIGSLLSFTGTRPDISEYGDGRASQKIAVELGRYLEKILRL